MLANLLDAVEAGSPELRHVNLMHGTKWYGNHLGPFKTPAREDDPRHMPPNFYYDQQDLVAARQHGKQWTWSTGRPHAICGFATGNPMNLVMVLAVYASISKALGLPLRHPGTAKNHRALYQCTDTALLSKAVVWMATDPRCANEPFNVTNGDVFRWEDLWPRIAAHFGMEVGLRQHIRLADMMRDKGPVWDRLVEEHGLRRVPDQEVVSWNYGDFVFSGGVRHHLHHDQGAAVRVLRGGGQRRHVPPHVRRAARAPGHSLKTSARSIALPCSDWKDRAREADGCEPARRLRSPPVEARSRAMGPLFGVLLDRCPCEERERSIVGGAGALTPPCKSGHPSNQRPSPLSPP